jgi:hypothetical protein
MEYNILETFLLYKPHPASIGGPSRHAQQRKPQTAIFTGNRIFPVCHNTVRGKEKTIKEIMLLQN